MSDTGLYGSVYEQLRTHAERLDRSLVDLRSHEPGVSARARSEIAKLLREIADKNPLNPATRFVAIILRQELPALCGKGLSRCESLADAVAQRAPNQVELNQLEQIAMALDKECSITLARIKGKR